MGFVCQRLKQLSLLLMGTTSKKFTWRPNPSKLLPAVSSRPLMLVLLQMKILVSPMFKDTKSSFLNKNKMLTPTKLSTIGTSYVGLSDGPAAKAKLSEPTGLCFDFDSVIFCCFGGSKTGYIKVHSSVDFACKFMAKIRQIYHAIRFLPKKSKTVWLSWERIPQPHLWREPICSLIP